MAGGVRWRDWPGGLLAWGDFGALGEALNLQLIRDCHAIIDRPLVTVEDVDM